MSFIEYIPLAGDKQETIGGVEREEPVTHELQEKLKEVPMSKSKSGRKWYLWYIYHFLENNQRSPCVKGQTVDSWFTLKFRKNISKRG